TQSTRTRMQASTGCNASFKAIRITARWCSDHCRKQAVRAGKLAGQQVPQPIISRTSPVEPQNDPAIGITGRISAVWYRREWYGRDIRDIKLPARGTEIDMPELPLFLDRRSPATPLREAA